jgi:hypothetical protein
MQIIFKISTTQCNKQLSLNLMLTSLCSKLQGHMHTVANPHYMSQPVPYGQYESQHTNVQR